MQSALDGLLHDAASVYRFVDFIEQYCAEQLVTQSYVKASASFFREISKLAKATKTYLSESIAAKAVERANAERDEDLDAAWYQNRRDALITVKDVWKELQGYVKPVADAHTLRVPAALVDLATSQLKAIPTMADASIAVLLTPQLNYFQTSHTNLNVAAAALKRKIGIRPPPGPEDAETPRIGFVELPYSQGPSFFTNLLLYHELGHYVFEELYPEEHGQSNPISEAAEVALKEEYGRKFTHMPRYKRAGAISLVSSWAQEVFCDLFAIRLIGPALSFSTIEMFSLVGLLTPVNSLKFTPTHPAPASRLCQHREQLVEDGWWNEVKTLDCEQKLLMERMAQVPTSEYRFYADEVVAARDQRTISAYLRVLPKIRKLVNEIIPPTNSELTAFRRERKDIAECFMHGIVPSRLVRRRKIVPAHPVAVINAAFCFYLSSMSRLIKTLQDQSPDKVKHRAHWTRRLEMWTIKAIEDFQLLDATNVGTNN
jgi:hypothetical protein